MSHPPFIVLEGIEGSGKSTQARLLGAWMTAQGVPHLTTREPGGTAIGERIRETVLHATELHIPPRSELLLITAARAAFVAEVVVPALEAGNVVVSDRFSWSTLAYQGHGRRLPLDDVRRIDAFATSGLEPDLYVLLDVTVAEGRKRQGNAGKVADRFEGEGDGFLERVRDGYLALARASDRATVVRGTGPEAEVQDRVREALRHRFPETFDGRGG